MSTPSSKAPQGIPVPVVDSGSAIRDIRAWIEDSAAPARFMGLQGPAVPGKDAIVGVVPTGDGVELVSLAKFIDEYSQKPHMRGGVVETRRFADFLAATTAWLVPDKTLVAFERAASSFRALALLDYHDRGAERGAHNGEWARFEITLDVSFGESYLRWTQFANRWQSTAAFAEFLDAAMLDLIVTVPGESLRCDRIRALRGVDFATPVEVLQSSRGLTVSQRRTVKDAILLDDTSVQIEYAEQNTPNVTVPSLFATRFPLFGTDVVVTIPWRLRYQFGKDGIAWFVTPIDLDGVINEAMAGVQAWFTEALPGALVVQGGAWVTSART